MKTRFLIFSVIVAASLYSCQASTDNTDNTDNGEQGYVPPTWDDSTYPTNAWRVVPPSKYGYNDDMAETLDAYLDAHPVTGIVVTVGGEMIYSWGDIDETSYLASCRKSLLSMMYGKYVADGTIDLDLTIGELIADGTIRDDVGGLLDIEKTATILNCITARSGVYHQGSNSGDNYSIAPQRGSQTPGTYYLYSNWDFNVSGSIFEGLTKKNIYDAFGEMLAVPLQFQDWDRSRQKKGGSSSISVYPAYHFYLSARDMARLGYLMLRDGSWNGTQIVPADWCAETTRAFTPLSEMTPVSSRTGSFGYGYMWWVWDGSANTGMFKGAYGAKGSGGQYITVLPALDMVVAQKRNKDILTSSYSENSYIQFLRTVGGQQIKKNYLVK